MKKFLLLTLAIAALVSCKKDNAKTKVPVPKAIDMGTIVNGVNVKWASFNLGASKPFENGAYYTLGETAPANDPTKQVLGGSWRLPTEDDWVALRDNCTWTWVTNYDNSGIDGSLVTNANNGNSIFLPAAGGWLENNLCFVGSEGFYWSSTLPSSNPGHWCCLYFTSGDVLIAHGDHQNKLSVRPVTE